MPPSPLDGINAKRDDIVGVMVMYIGRPRFGKMQHDWEVWGIDRDRKTFKVDMDDGKLVIP